MGSEKRGYKRRIVGDGERYLFIYKPKEKFFSKSHVALTINLSASGLLFRATELMALNAILKGSIEIPPLKRKFKLEAKVVRVEATGREGIYDVAIYFTKIKESDQELINRFCLSIHDGEEKIEFTDNPIDQTEEGGEEAKEETKKSDQE